jgi:hypothetical protein
MEHDDRPESRPHPPRADPTPPPTDAELSRIAREAVRQPADPRIDKQLARMGLTDPPEAADHAPSQPKSRSVATDADLDGIRKEVRRLEAIVWVLVAFTGFLAVLVAVLLIR